MKQLTLRGIDDELHERLLCVAEEEGISLNQAALKLLREAAELENGGVALVPAELRKWTGGVQEHGRARQDGPTADRGLDPAMASLFGTWTDAEADEFNAAVEDMFETIDEHMWE